MTYNGANCDIFIGQEAGKTLLYDIANANHSVKIVSPYLSPELVNELIILHEKGIQVELITSDDIPENRHSYEKNILKLIKQNRTIDYPAVQKREDWKSKVKRWNYVGYVFTAILLALAYYYQDFRILGGLIGIAFLAGIINSYKQKIKHTRIYKYWYTQLFTFKVYGSWYNSASETTIHSKIYIIDDCIAYLGSINFTWSGIKHNYETRIKTTDTKAVHEINGEFFDLMHNRDIPERDIQKWGKELYREPIN